MIPPIFKSLNGLFNLCFFIQQLNQLLKRIHVTQIHVGSTQTNPEEMEIAVTVPVFLEWQGPLLTVDQSAFLTKTVRQTKLVNNKNVWILALACVAVMQTAE